MPAAVPGADIAPEPAAAQKLEEIQNQAIVEALQKNTFNRAEAARTLGISRRTLIYNLQKLRELGFEVDPPASAA